MNVKNIESTQPTFGTRVRMDAHTARILSLSKPRNKVLKDIKILENNGVDDVLNLSAIYRDGEFHIKTSLFKELGSKYYYVSIKEEMEPIVQKAENGKNKYINLKKMYQEAAETLKYYQIFIGKKKFEKFLPYVV